MPPAAGWWSGTPRSISLLGSVMMRIVSGPRCYRGPIKGSLEQDKPPYRAFAAVLTQLIVICPRAVRTMSRIGSSGGGGNLRGGGGGARGENFFGFFFFFWGGGGFLFLWGV